MEGKLYRKNVGEVTKAFTGEQVASSGSFLMHPPNYYVHPPFLHFTEKLRKPYASVLNLIFHFFLFPFTNMM